MLNPTMLDDVGPTRWLSLPNSCFSWRDFVVYLFPPRQVSRALFTCRRKQFRAPGDKMAYKARFRHRTFHMRGT